VRGFTQLFRKKLEGQGDAKLCEFADLVIREVDRLNTVIGNMLNFSKPVEPQFEPQMLDQLVNNVFRLIRSDAMSRHVTLISHVPAALPRIHVDTTLFTQALLNLVINALDAMPQGGELTVEAHEGPAGNVHIAVRDTGKGIPREHLEQIFDPFFTTKPTGTGLGLATVENIVAEHSGSVSVESDVGRGSVFHIELPRAVDAAA
jgi:two-component system sensor histidine kinase HydH